MEDSSTTVERRFSVKTKLMAFAFSAVEKTGDELAYPGAAALVAYLHGTSESKCCHYNGCQRPLSGSAAL